nr:craniofacial development protein 2-like [Tanacetum cinerariifolium]
IKPVDSDGHLRSCLGFGVVDGGRRTRSYDRLAGPVGFRVREGNGYKLCYSGSSNARNNVGIILSGRLKDNVVRVTKRSDRIMAMSVVIEGETANFISVYTPRVGLSDAKKRRFWDAVDELVRECLTDQRLIIGGNLNRNIEAAVDEYTRVHGGFGFGYRNEEGCTILEFATAHDLVVANSYFKKSDAYLITNEATGRPRILWKNLKGEAVETFRATVVERLTALEEVMSASGANQMWNTFSRVMKVWFKELLSCHEGDQEDIDLVKERYKVAKKEAKIAVANAKDKSYKGLYKKLDSKEGVNDIYKISKAQERRRMDRKCEIYQR